MKKIIKKFWKGIKRAFYKLRAKTRHIVPIAIKIVDAIKKVMDSPVDNFILSIVTDSIPGDADDILVKKVTEFVEKEIPRLLLKLRLINSIAGIEDPNEQLRAIIAEFQPMDKGTRKYYLHAIATKAIEFLSDDELSWSEAVILSEMEYVETKIK